MNKTIKEKIAIRKVKEAIATQIGKAKMLAKRKTYPNLIIIKRIGLIELKMGSTAMIESRELMRQWPFGVPSHALAALAKATRRPGVKKTFEDVIALCEQRDLANVMFTPNA